MLSRVVVYYWHQGSWIWCRDYPVSQEEDAKEYGRKLWRDGAEGVKISKWEEVVVVEHRRSSEPASRLAPHRPAPATTATSEPQRGSQNRLRPTACGPTARRK